MSDAPYPLDVDPDLRRARTPRGDFYRDERWFRWQRERLFARSWQWAPSLAAVRAHGEVAPFTLLQGLLDEPLVAVRDGDEVRCLSNACTHRGNLLVTSPCRLNALRCGYHGRRFGLDGGCRAAPGFDDVPREGWTGDDLSRAQVAWWRALPFVSLDPEHTFEAWAGDATARLATLPLERLVADPAGARSFTVRAHWALYVENYLEGLHVPFVHPGLQRALSMPEYRTELFAHGSLQVGPAREGDHDLLPVDDAHAGERVGAYYLWLFPNTMLNFYPWGLSVNVVVPEAVDRTRVDYARYVWEPSKLGLGAGGDLDAVELEDDAVVEAVHRGIGARLYGRGRYSPTWEAGVHAFHRMVARAAGE